MEDKKKKTTTNKKTTTAKKTTAKKNTKAEVKKETVVEEIKPAKKEAKPKKTKKVTIEEPKKMKKLQTEENIIVKRFIVVLLVVVIGVVLVYLFTRAFVSKDLFNSKKDTTQETEVTFNYDQTILGSAFNRPYSEYYVIIYNSTSEEASNLSTVMATYMYTENTTKLYFADLNNHLNKSFYDPENVNYNATKASELKVGDYTLIKIKDGAIEKYIEGVEAIQKELTV